jgi:hypothetical protein
MPSQKVVNASERLLEVHNDKVHYVYCYHRTADCPKIPQTAWREVGGNDSRIQTAAGGQHHSTVYITLAIAYGAES